MTSTAWLALGQLEVVAQSADRAQGPSGPLTAPSARSATPGASDSTAEMIAAQNCAGSRSDSSRASQADGRRGARSPVGGQRGLARPGRGDHRRHRVRREVVQQLGQPGPVHEVLRRRGHAELGPEEGGVDAPALDQRGAACVRA